MSTTPDTLSDSQGWKPCFIHFWTLCAEHISEICTEFMLCGWINEWMNEQKKKYKQLDFKSPESQGQLFGQFRNFSAAFYQKKYLDIHWGNVGRPEARQFEDVLLRFNPSLSILSMSHHLFPDYKSKEEERKFGGWSAIFLSQVICAQGPLCFPTAFSYPNCGLRVIGAGLAMDGKGVRGQDR